MEMLLERVAGLDIDKASLTVCICARGSRGAALGDRTYPTLTGALEVIRDWLSAEGATESTSRDWKPPFNYLEEFSETFAAPLRAHQGHAAAEDRRQGTQADRPAGRMRAGAPVYGAAAEDRRLLMLTKLSGAADGRSHLRLGGWGSRLNHPSNESYSVASSLTRLRARSDADRGLSPASAIRPFRSGQRQDTSRDLGPD